MRTSDGAVVKGKRPFGNVNYGGRFNANDDIVTSPPFKPACYQAKTAKSATYEGREVEAIGLHCSTRMTSQQRVLLTDTTMRTLYVRVDAATSMPTVCRVLSMTPLLRELIVRATELPVQYDETGPAGLR